MRQDNLNTVYGNAIRKKLERLTLNINRATSYLAVKSRERTPLDTGHLRESTFGKSVSPFQGQVGNTAKYGLFVHEDLGGHKYKVGGPKFIESIILESESEIRSILSKGM